METNPKRQQAEVADEPSHRSPSPSTAAHLDGLALLAIGPDVLGLLGQSVHAHHSEASLQGKGRQGRELRQRPAGGRRRRGRQRSSWEATL